MHDPAARSLAEPAREVTSLPASVTLRAASTSLCWVAYPATSNSLNVPSELTLIVLLCAPHCTASLSSHCKYSVQPFRWDVGLKIVLGFVGVLLDVSGKHVTENNSEISGRISYLVRFCSFNLKTLLCRFWAKERIYRSVAASKIPWHFTANDVAEAGFTYVNCSVLYCYLRSSILISYPINIFICGPRMHWTPSGHANERNAMQS